MQKKAILSIWIRHIQSTPFSFTLPQNNILGLMSLHGEEYNKKEQEEGPITLLLVIIIVVAVVLPLHFQLDGILKQLMI